MIVPNRASAAERWWVRWEPLRRPTERILHLFLLVVVGIFIGIALYLEPNPKGFGTHQQLGLPPCSLYFLTGRPCPSCGLTTSVCAIFHGDWWLAWRANPIGWLIVGVVVGVGLNSLLALFTGRSVRFHPDRLPYLLIALLAVWLAHGLVRMLIWRV
ncbi:MAG: DUF2752 domain-containing protein [Fimbriimonadales bacterium]